jgi:hypothetical protein
MLKKESTGLIVIDVQGKLARMVYDSEVLVANGGKLIKGTQALGLPIIWLEQNPAKLGATVAELSALLAEQTLRLSLLLMPVKRLCLSSKLKQLILITGLFVVLKPICVFIKQRYTCNSWATKCNLLVIVCLHVH